MGKPKNKKSHLVEDIEREIDEALENGDEDLAFDLEMELNEAEEDDEGVFHVA